MSKEGDEMRIAGIIAAGVGLVLTLVVLFNGCSESPDYHPQPSPAAVTSEGCALPDAGADLGGSPGQGVGGFPE